MKKKRPGKTKSVGETAKPTGFEPTALPFYEQLDASRFEQFCTDFLNQHPRIPTLRGDLRVDEARRLLTGTSQRGADIWAKMSQGEEWVFQCKREKSFGRSDVEEAVGEAEAGFPLADRYVLITTCGLSDEAQDLLRERPKWSWWDASRLTSLVCGLEPVEGGIRLVTRHFGLEWVKKLFPWGSQPFLPWFEFFARELAAERRWFHHRAPFVSHAKELQRLREFSSSGSQKALIVRATGGQGKSRLLLELARGFDEPGSPLRARFLHLGQPQLTEEQWDGLTRERDLLLIVDDAHRLSESLEEVARAVSRAPSVRLVVAARPEGVEAIRSILYRSGFADQMDEDVSLRGWRPEEMLKLAEECLPPRLGQHAVRLVEMSGRCPLLVVMGAEALSSGSSPESLVASVDFRERVLKGFRDDLLGQYHGSRRERLRGLIELLSFVGPVPMDADLIRRMVPASGSTETELAEDLDELLNAGLALENREGVRLYPDLFADEVLISACIGSNGKPARSASQRLSRLEVSDFPSLLRNVAQADWGVRARFGAKSSLFDSVWDDFLGHFKEAPAEERSGLLHQWAAMAGFQPERTLELAHLVLNQGGEQVALLPAILAPIVVWHPKCATQALDLLWDLEEHLCSRDQAPGSEPIQVIARAAGFEFEKPLSTSKVVLEWLRSKLRSPQARERIDRNPYLLGALLKPFFARTMERQSQIGMRIRFERGAWPVEATRPIREGALELIEVLLTEADARRALALLPVLERAVERVTIDQYQEVKDEHRKAWRPDRLAALGVLERMIGRFTDQPIVLLKVRKELLEIARFDRDEVMAARLREVLEKVPDSFDLRVLRVLTAYPHEEVEVDREIPTDDRYAEMEKVWQRLCAGVAEEMVSRYREVGEWWKEARRWIDAVREAGLTARGEVLVEAVAGLSRNWAGRVLDLLLASRDESLEEMSAAVFRAVFRRDPDGMESRFPKIVSGDRLQLHLGMVDFLGWRSSTAVARRGTKEAEFVQRDENTEVDRSDDGHSTEKRLPLAGGLTEAERAVLQHLAQRRDPNLVRGILRTLGVFFRSEANWAMELIGRMEIPDGECCDELIRTLDFLTDGPKILPERLDGCFAVIRRRASSTPASVSTHLVSIAARYPIQVYEALSAATDIPFDHLTFRSSWEEDCFIEGALPLGPIADEVFLTREIETQWAQLRCSTPSSHAYGNHLGLLRSLLTAAADSVAHLRRLLERSTIADEVLDVVRAANPPGSAILLVEPEFVRASIARAMELGGRAEIESVWFSNALNRFGGFSDGLPDARGAQFATRVDELARRHTGDELLGPLFQKIATAVKTHNDQVKSEFDAMVAG